MIDYRDTHFEEDEGNIIHDCIWTACFVIVFFGLIAFATVG